MVKRILLLSSVLFLLLLSQMSEKCLADAAGELEQAKAYFNNRQYEQAEQAYKDIVQNYPDTDQAVWAQSRLARLYIKLENIAAAQLATESLTADFSGHSDLPAAAAVTTDELARICEEMESAIVDISVEYQWYNDSTLTLEKKLEYAAEKRLLVEVNIPNYKFSAARSLSARDPNNPNFLVFDRLLLENTSTIMNAEGNSWDSLTKASYNGEVAKHLQVGGWPRELRNGGISQSKRYYMLPMNLTPIGFSVLRVNNDPAFRASNNGERALLSAWLRDKELAHLDNTVKKVNGFNTIRADFLNNTDKTAYFRAYFSVDHGYTPIKYEYMRGGGQVAFSVEVHSLEQVGQGLWFPSGGVIRAPDDKDTNVYIATSGIIVNQGLADEHFDIEFPPGTKVQDEIRNLRYVVKPTEEQFEQ